MTAVAMAIPADGPSFGVAPFRHVDVDVALLEHRRFDAVVDGAGAHIGRCGGNGFLHHVLQVARHRHLALAGHHDAFDGEQLSADLGPGKTGDDTDLILQFGLAVAIARYAEIGFNDVRGDDNLFLVAHQDVLDRLTGKGRHFTFKVTHARLTGVAAHHEAQGLVLDREFAIAQAMILFRLRQQVPAADLDLLVLGCNRQYG